MAMLLAIVVMVPAGFTFFNVYQESSFEIEAQAFVNNELDALPHSEYIKKNTIYKYGGDEGSVIELNSFGLDEIPESTISVLQSRLASYPALNKFNTKLKFNQSRSKGMDNFKYMEELRTRDSLDLLSQNEKIAYLENKVKQLSKLEHNYIPFKELAEEVKINYETIEQFSYANVINSTFKKMKVLN